MVHDVIAASMITEQVHRKEGKEKSGRLTVPTLRACHAAFPGFGTAVDFFTGAILSSSSPFRMAVINVSMTAEILSIYVQRIRGDVALWHPTADHRTRRGQLFCRNLLPSYCGI